MNQDPLSFRPTITHSLASYFSPSLIEHHLTYFSLLIYSSSTRQVQIHRLAELIERKAELEVNIFQAIRGVEKVYDNMKEDFVAVLKGRLDDVRKGIVGVEETGWGGEDEVGIEGQGGEGGA